MFNGVFLVGRQVLKPSLAVSATAPCCSRLFTFIDVLFRNVPSVGETGACLLLHAC